MRIGFQRVRDVSLLTFAALLFSSVGLRAGDATPFQAGDGKIAAGGRFGLALKPDGTVWAWGDVMALGNNTTQRNYTASSVPLPVRKLSAITAVAAGGLHCLALKADGTVWAWGHSGYGQMGNGMVSRTQNRGGVFLPVDIPAMVSNVTGITSIACGRWHNMALKSDGTIWTWGQGTYGQLGDGEKKDRSKPVQVRGLTGVMAVAGGPFHSLALKSDGTVWAWGNNTYGQLGSGDGTDHLVPIPVKGLTEVAAIAAGGRGVGGYNLALKLDGTVWAWGINLFGVLGDGTKTNHCAPAPVKNLTGITAISCSQGLYHCLALQADGTVWKWGNSVFELVDYSGQNRQTAHSLVPVKLPKLSDVAAIACGESHDLVKKKDGTVWAWGINQMGQLGNGATIAYTKNPTNIWPTSSLDPVQVVASEIEKK